VAQPAKIIDPDFEFLQDQYSGIHRNDSENPGLLIIIVRPFKSTIGEKNHRHIPHHFRVIAGSC
jgi:hypothetical protein